MTGYDDLQRKLDVLRNGTAEKALLLELGYNVVREAQINLQGHTKTGFLARSIRVSAVDVQGQSIEVRAGGTRGVNYATYLEFGTGIYGEGPGARRRPIVPVRARALRFPAAGSGVRLSGNQTRAQQRDGGGWQFAKSVKGVKPVYYMRDAVTATARTYQLGPAIVAEWNRA